MLIALNFQCQDNTFVDVPFNVATEVIEAFRKWMQLRSHPGDDQRSIETRKVGPK